MLIEADVHLVLFSCFVQVDSSPMISTKRHTSLSMMSIVFSAIIRRTLENIDNTLFTFKFVDEKRFVDLLLLLRFQWFWECLCLMGKADESIYAVNFTGATLMSTPDSSLIVANESPLLDTSLNTTVKRKRRQKHSYRTDPIPQSKRFNSSSNDHENLDYDEQINSLTIEKQSMLKKDHKYLIGMELRETERNYVTMLSNIIRIFKTEMEKDDRRNGPILTKVESSQIFGNIEEIYHLHLSIADQLDRALHDDECIGTVFLSNVSRIEFSFVFIIIIDFSRSNYFEFINLTQNSTIKRSKRFTI